MSVTFLSSLGFGLTALLISTQTQRDTANLAMLVATVALLVSLIFAPWPLKLVLLLLLVWRSKMSPPAPATSDKTSMTTDSSQTPATADTPSFCYRGISYGRNLASALHKASEALPGKYRGVPTPSSDPDTDNASAP